MHHRHARGQSTAEYAIVLALVVGAVMAMQLYVKRGVQAKIKAGTDTVVIPGVQNLEQYEPYYANVNTQTQQQQHMEENYDAGNVNRQGNVDVQRHGQEIQGGADQMASDNQWQ